MRKQQKQEAAMGREKGEMRGLLARVKTQPVSPLEWDSERGGPRPPKWQKTQGVFAREWEGVSTC